MAVDTVFAIETSCDDTCAAVVKEGHCILSNVVSSQHEFHAPHGGIVPEIAARRHTEMIAQVADRACCDAGMKWSDIQAVAVTNRPGLSSSLMVGVSFAKTLSLALQIPLIGIDHMEGHLYSCHMEHGAALPFPHICLVVSGGHTLLVWGEENRKYRVIGGTTDDAAGEAFDKVARILGLGFPGGPAVANAAQCETTTTIEFPQPLRDADNFDFSFSGLKTAVKYYCDKLDVLQKVERTAEIAAAFQEAVVAVLVTKTLRAALTHGAKAIALCGGVSANRRLREEMALRARCHDISVLCPSPKFCTDNAAMIAGLAYHKLQAGVMDDYDLEVATRSTIFGH